jgi:hypothetical protein
MASVDPLNAGQMNMGSERRRREAQGGVFCGAPYLEQEGEPAVPVGHCAIRKDGVGSRRGSGREEGRSQRGDNVTTGMLAG